MRRLSALVLLVTMLALTAPGAQARDVADLAVSPSKTIAEADYAGGPVFLTGADSHTYTPAVCRTADYCDVIDLSISIPEDYPDDFNIRITLSWAAGTSGVDGSATDLDMTLYTEGETVSASAATSANPEVIRIAYATPGKYFITVLQFNDINVVYNVLVEFIVRQTIQPKKKVSTFGVTNPYSEPPSYSDPFFGDFGSFGLGIVPVGDLSALEPIAIDIPEDDTDEAIGFGPLDEDGEVASSIRFDGERLSLGLAFVGVIGLISYLLFFVPRRVPARKTVQAA